MYLKLKSNYAKGSIYRGLSLTLLLSFSTHSAGDQSASNACKVNAKVVEGLAETRDSGKSRNEMIRPIIENNSIDDANKYLIISWVEYVYEKDNLSPEDIFIEFYNSCLGAAVTR